VSRQAATALPASQPLRGVMCFALSRRAWTTSAATTAPPGSRDPEISLLGRLIRRTTPPKCHLFTQTARADCFAPANDTTQFGFSQTTRFGSDLLRNWQLLENGYPDFVGGYWRRVDLHAPSTGGKEFPALGAAAIFGVTGCSGTLPRSSVLTGPHEHRPGPR